MPPKRKSTKDEVASKASKKAATSAEEVDVSGAGGAVESGGAAPKEATANAALPYENCSFVVTGTFPVSSDMMGRKIEALGGRVVSAVAKSTTHLLLGESGKTDYGQATGKGSKKYKDAKKNKCTIVEYSDFVAVEAAALAAASAGAGGSGGAPIAPTSKLAEEWAALLTAVHRGVALGAWPEPVIPPPATLEEIAALEADMGYRIGGYADLLLLANGMHWYAPGNTCLSVTFGGTGDAEEDLRCAFNYSGDYGRNHYRQKKQVPMQMVDYDMCVNVFEVKTGRIMQDDRECGSFNLIADSLSSWLTQQTEAIYKALQPLESAAPILK